MSKSQTKAELIERVRYDLTTELSGLKEFGGWSINEVGALADKAMKGVKREALGR